MQPKREQILRTTCRLLETQGYHATGLNQIVRESGTPKGSLYHYFPDGKEQIAAESIALNTRVVAERIQENLSAHADPAQAIQIFANLVADNVEASGFTAGGPLMMVAMETAIDSDQINQACRQAYETMRSAFENKLLESGFAAAQAAKLSTVILASMEGGIMLSRTYHDGQPLRDVGAYLARVVQHSSPA